MGSLAYDCLWIFMLMTLSLCQQDLSENKNATEREIETFADEEPKSVSHLPKPTAKTTSATNHHNNHQQKLKLTNNKEIFVDSGRQRLPPPAGDNLPIFGLNDNFEEAEPIDDFGRRHKIRLHHYQPQSPTDFNAALGAISAHIVSQNPEAEEYVPYPPNGDPYNYPPYLGQPQVTEPPVIRAYEAASYANDFVRPQSAANFNRFDNSGIYRNAGGYGFPNHHDNVGFNFYNDRHFFQGEGGGFTGRNVEPVGELGSLFREPQVHYGRPLSRVANL